MEFAQQLFFLKTEGIQIDIRLGWEKDVLLLDGYDIGKTVTELRGDSDYEYQIMVKGTALEKLYSITGIEAGEKKQLVEALAEKINGNRSYSLFQDYLAGHDIQFESFTY